MTEAAATPTAFISWAHMPNNGLEADAWVRQVFTFTNALRSEGVDADVDLFHLQDLGINWAHYGPSKIAEADFTLAVMNRAWKERFEGNNQPTEGAGAVAEANVLHGMFAAHQGKLTKRLILVLLPGTAPTDVPFELSVYQYIRLESLTLAGVTPLLRLLFQKPAWVPAPLGMRPHLDPVGVFEPPSAEEVDKAIDGASDSGAPRVAAETSPIPGVDPLGWPEVNRALALNPTGALVRELLTAVAGWPNVGIRGKQNRAKGTLEYDKYLSLSVPGRPIFGYIWPKTGVVNPRATFNSPEDLAAVAAQATFLASKTNVSYPVRFNVDNREALKQALRMLEAAWHAA